MATLPAVSLSDRYTEIRGTVFLSGIQALVRLPLDQMRRDRERGLNTGAFISGYRGSPLGGFDTQLTRNKSLLDEHNIRFQPGVNEELGATAVWGSQQVNLFEGATVDGVCGIWYGKSPGVDRSTDAFRHGNASGSSKYGGVLVVAGDDHGCKSSSYPGQSEFAFVDMHMPVLNPADVQEVLEFGLYGFELSRYSGCWVALIALSENMDSGATVEVAPERVQINHPRGVDMPPEGLNIRLPDTPLAQEERLWRYKRPAAIAFARENTLNRETLTNESARFGVVTTGKGHLDFMQALALMGIDEERAKALGLRVLKVGMTYPLDVEGVVEFARGLEYLLVVEEKRSLIEVQLKEDLYNIEVVDPNFPKIIGKVDSKNNNLLPAYGELSPMIIVDVLKQLLPEWVAQEPVEASRLEALASGSHLYQFDGSPVRVPFFCSGCPHNTSTKVPEGSRALAGIGCHYLVQGMNRDTHTFTQMGGEGVTWIGQSHFTETDHVFVNLGDGTYFHSGVLAIRASVSAGVNITYKILFNDAVAMTGGQPHDGDLRPESIIEQVLAEGVKHVVWVMEDLRKYGAKPVVPSGVQVRHRREMDKIQRELRETEGVSCIIYDQECATELRRKRKRGLAPAAGRRVLINDLVCEGCGDCSSKSNCISIEPKETTFGIKRSINQSSCNQDLSCVDGFCPSFVTVEGGSLRQPETKTTELLSLGQALTVPATPVLHRPWSILITGVGGTGVVTLGAVLSMAASLEKKAVTTLDQTGLAQKGGAVYSHIRIADNNSQLHAVRIAAGDADALIACDIVGASVPEACLSKLDSSKTRCVANTVAPPTASFVLGGDESNHVERLFDGLEGLCANIDALDAFDLSNCVLGGSAFANMVLLGAAFQRGLIPLQLESIFTAVDLNGVAIEENKAAIHLGRLAISHTPELEKLLPVEASATPVTESLDALIEHRVSFLTEYQNEAYADRYRSLVERVLNAERSVHPESQLLSFAVAKYAAKLMAYKDEYEVARLFTNGYFDKQLSKTFTGNYKLIFNLAPPLLSRSKDRQGPQKMQFGPWVLVLFRFMAPLKRIRGSWLDPFSYLEERKKERELIQRYFDTVDSLIANLNTDNIPYASQIASLPDEIRGYGHVKQRSLVEVSSKWERMLDSYREGAKASPLVENVQVIEVAEVQ